MTPLSGLSGQWPAISVLLDEALDLPPASHAAWLAGLTGEQAAHREVLDELLAHRAEVQADDFLADGPKLDAIPDSAPSTALAEGTQVGTYRLIAEIGRGGMGTVWLAERSDRLMRRRVALKLPRIVWGDTFAERLGRERDILASLEHPHIARLYDAGVDAHGRPFLAMEYVDGEPIDEHCRRHALPVRERIGLLLQVMAAVAHAHARLVVHRDLKPGNILVTKQGQVRLLDFGIAKLLADDRTHCTALTELSGRALTLDYASPEQVRGEPLGTASDVYSLGVVVYELLTQARPYRLKRGTAAEMEEAIAGVEPRLASDAAEAPATKKALRGDLDAILNRALKKSVVDRYPSVDAFAQDLQRHLDGEPVQARPDRAAYRTAKFIGRHRLAVAMGTALGLSVLGGSAVAVWQAQIARAQERLATNEAGAKSAVIDLYLATIMQLSLLGAENPDALRRPGAVTSVLLDKLRELSPRTAQRPDDRSAQLKATVLQLNFDNRFEDSLALGREQLVYLKAHDVPPSQVINAYEILGSNLFHLQRYDECEAAWRGGVEWAPDAHDRDTAFFRMQASAELSRVLTLRGKRREALAVLARADAEVTSRFADEHLRYFVLSKLSAVQLGFDDVQALRFMREARTDLLANGTGDDYELGSNAWQLGEALLANGLSSEADAMLAESLRIFRGEFGRGSRNVVRAFGRWVQAVARRDPARALALIDAERRALETATGALPPIADLQFSALRLEIAWLTGDADAARGVALPEDARLLAPSALRDNESLLIDVVRARRLLGRTADALRLIEAVRTAWPDDHRPTAAWLRIEETLAETRLEAGDAAGARRVAGELLSLLEQEGAVTGRAYRVAAELGALAAARLGDKADAARSLALADAASPPPPFPSHVERAESSLRHAQIDSALGRPTEAASAARTALADLSAQHPGSPRLALARRFAGMETVANR